MMSNMDVNCEKMIVFSPSGRSWMSRKIFNIIRIFADSAGSDPLATACRFDLSARRLQSLQCGDSSVEFEGVKLY